MTEYTNNSEGSVPERAETAFLPVDWGVNPEEIRQMTPEKKITFYNIIKTIITFYQ